MKIEIFTEGSRTTADPESVEQVKDYFKGHFLPVNNLANEISQAGDVTMHILSNEHGYLLNSDDPSELELRRETRSKAEFKQSLIESSATADIVVILLTTPTFKEIVTSQWDDLVSSTSQDSIWCLGASHGALSSIDINELESRVHSVLTYQRVGVAPIGTETKQKLVDIVMAED